MRRRRSGASAPDARVDRDDRRAGAHAAGRRSRAVGAARAARGTRDPSHTRDAARRPAARAGRTRAAPDGRSPPVRTSTAPRNSGEPQRARACSPLERDDLGAVDGLRARRRPGPARRDAASAAPRDTRRRRPASSHHAPIARTLASRLARRPRRPPARRSARCSAGAVQRQRGHEAAVAPARPVPAAPGLEHDDRGARLGAGARRPTGPCSRRRPRRRRRCVSPSSGASARRRARLRDPPAVGVVAHGRRHYPRTPCARS